MSGYRRREDCRLCRRSDLALVMEVASTPIGDAYLPSAETASGLRTYPLELLWCHRCGNLQLGGIVTPELVYADYIYESAGSLGLADHFARYATAIVTQLGLQPSGRLAVDIGSNDGTLLAALRTHGFEVLGVEPGRQISKTANSRGIETVTGFFSAGLAAGLAEEQGKALLITANNVIANIDDLEDVMEGIRVLLADDGVFVFETGYVVDTIQGTVLDNIYHEHLNYFGVGPLRKFLEGQRFELFHVDRVATKAGSIRLFVQHSGGPRLDTRSTAALANLEEELGFQRPTPFHAFRARCEEARERLLASIEAIESAAKLPGYGASVGTTTLMHFFGLAGSLDCLLDDNPAREGLHSPGAAVPVKSPDVVLQTMPAAVVLFAWRYAAPILKRSCDYLGAGGQFLAPLPVFEVLDKSSLV